MEKTLNLNNLYLVAIVGIVAVVAIVFGFSYASGITGYATYTQPGNPDRPHMLIWHKGDWYSPNPQDPAAPPELECVIVDFNVKSYKKLFKKDMEYYKLMINCARAKDGVFVNASGYNGSADSIIIKYG